MGAGHKVCPYIQNDARPFDDDEGMQYNPDRHRRRSIRLKDYDYAQPGAYFVTICTHGRVCLFGDIVDGQMVFNPLGQIVHDEWLHTPEIRSEVELDAFQVMPNHFHAIVMVTHSPSPKPTVGAHGRAPLHRPPKSLGSIIAGFKAAATKRVNQLRGAPGIPVWQRNYYEHVIRDEGKLDTIRQYIVDNPAKWAEDPENPRNLRL